MTFPLQVHFNRVKTGNIAVLNSVVYLNQQNDLPLSSTTYSKLYILELHFYPPHGCQRM